MKKLFLGSILVGMGLLLSTAALAQAGAVQLKAVLVPSTMVSGHLRLGFVQLNQITMSDVTVALASTTGATVPSSVTILSGDSYAAFQIHAAAVSMETDVTISASLNTTTLSAKLKVVPATFSFFLATQYVVGGTNGAGAVFLNGAAGAGANVTLASSSPVLTVASPLNIPMGADNAAFIFHTKGVNADTTATLTATYNGVTKSREIHIFPAHEAALLLTPSTVTGGHNSYGHVFLKGKEGAGGYVVTLGSNNKAAIVPDSVKVPQGEDEASFPIKTLGVDAEVDATITATFDGTSRLALLTIEPAALDHLVAPDNIVGGIQGTAAAVLNGAACPSGVTVSLDCDSNVIMVPASVKVAAGTWAKSFAFTSRGVDVDRYPTIIATAGSVTRTATVHVHPAALAGIHAYPLSVIGGKPVKLEVNLNGKAGPGGATVTLSSSAPGVIKVPANTKILFGDFAVALMVPTQVVHATTVVTISATYEGVTKTVAITVQPAP